MKAPFEEPPGATLLDPDEMEGLKFKHVTTRGELDELEQANVESGLLWLSRQRKLNVLTEGFALKLHQQLFGGVWHWAGTFRKTEKNIGIDPLYISVELRKLLDDARYWAGHKTYAPVEAAARFHHRLVSIHLFANGNGRHARILADAMLDWVYATPPIDWAGGQNLQVFNDLRTHYIHALRAADRGDINPLLVFVGVGNK